MGQTVYIHVLVRSGDDYAEATKECSWLLEAGDSGSPAVFLCSWVEVPLGSDRKDSPGGTLRSWTVKDKQL